MPVHTKAHSTVAVTTGLAVVLVALPGAATALATRLHQRPSSSLCRCSDQAVGLEDLCKGPRMLVCLCLDVCGWVGDGGLKPRNGATASWDFGISCRPVSAISVLEFRAHVAVVSCLMKENAR